jgi:hypothetical protein
VCHVALQIIFFLFQHILQNARIMTDGLVLIITFTIDDE